MTTPASKVAGRLILLGVTGSIAAYKSAELCRALTAAGADVQTLLSRSGPRRRAGWARWPPASPMT
jgi:phosphopantothenoylcysteine decarboxylase/phosphopantothenate--cysteine ligase